MTQNAPWQVFYSSGVRAPGPVAVSMLDQFRRAVSCNPGAPVILYFDATLSYADLDRLSDQLAHYWFVAGVKPGDRTAIILQNVPQFVVAVVAAWKLGAIPVPMNPMYRKAELTKLFLDCEVSAILCHDTDSALVAAAAKGLTIASLLTTSALDIQTRDDARILPARTETTARDLLTELSCMNKQDVPPRDATANDIGLLLYTSGTTGVPKGAMLTHASLAGNAAICRDWFELTEASRLFAVAPLFHVTGFLCSMCAAFAGAAPLILTYRFAPKVVLEAFREHQPTFIIGAITAFIALLEEPSAQPEDFASFAHVFSGGAPIPPSVVARFAGWSGKQIRTAYGMTETASPTHLAPVSGLIPIDPASGTLSIGIPVPGTEAMIVGEDQQPLPVGEVGEIKVRGRQIMSGYWRKPTETAEVLVDGWMHTGDIGFCDAAGWFYLIDRKKDMISASGFKVWPREVEDALYHHPAVREAAVVGEPDAYRGETVLAYVAFAPGKSAEPQELIAWCRERLAAYKCPRRVEVLSELPKTITGKIVRADLRKSTKAPI